MAMTSSARAPCCVAWAAGDAPGHERPRATARWVPLMPELNGRTAVVTGAATGIGRGLAREAARRGATVLAVDMENPAETVDMIEADGGRATGAICDITDEAGLQKLAAANP